MTETRWEVKIGATVRTSDGEYGRLQELLLDPRQERLAALVVRRQGLAPSPDRIVSEEQIAEATESRVQLKIGRKEIEAQPEYKMDSVWVMDDEEFVVRGRDGFDLVYSPEASQPGWIVSYPQEAAPAQLTFPARAGQSVFCKDAYAGHVSLVLLTPQGNIQGFVLHENRFPGRQRIVPAAQVIEFDKKSIYLSIEKSDLKNLHLYVSDEALASEVNRALWTDEILRFSDYKEIGVSVEDGRVRLQGHVANPMNKSRASRLARSVEGVLRLENDLVVDPDLVIETAHALGTDERTRTERISVGAQNGVITLAGQVGSATIREAAEAVTAGVPHVRGIKNFLRAPGIDIDPQSEQVHQPLIGRCVYTGDGLLGRVEQVVINPRTRQVDAFVTVGAFSVPKFTEKDTALVPVPCLEERLLVPVNEIRFESDTAVMLRIKIDKAASGHDFRTDDFIRPPEEWEPPYPYRSQDVLFKWEVPGETADANLSK